MRARTLSSLLMIALSVALVLPSRAATPQANTLLATYTLPNLSLAEVQNAVLPGSIPDDRGFKLGGIGSDLWRSPADPANEFWMLTDRGPNGQICPQPPQPGCSTRRTFPVPEFDPLILRVRAEGNTLTLLQTIPIVTQEMTPVTGLPNIPQGSGQANDEAPYNYDANTPLLYNPNGLDPEGLVRTSTGEFWLVDEYRPSIVHVASNGKVIRRYIPAGVTLNASYPISATLPAIFDKRTRNRGFEGIAISPDEKTLYAALQSPLSNPNRTAGGTSRNTRILVFDPATGQPTAQYVYRFDLQSEFDPSAPVNPQRPNDEMKVSGLIALDKNTLLVLERTDGVAKIYKVDLSAATNILGTAWDNVATSPTLEQTDDLAAAGVTALPKTLIADLETINAPDKIEGMAMVGSNTLAIINDNDFGIDGDTGLPAANPASSQLLVFNTQLTTALPNLVAAGDVTQRSAVLWARASALGQMTFAYSTSASFTGAISVTATISDTLIPTRVTLSNLTPGQRYYYRATDSAGASAQGQFSTAPISGFNGLRFGVSGDWRGDLSPFPAVANAPGRNLAFFVAHGDTVYADVPSPGLPLPQATTLEQYRVKNNEVYASRYGRNTLGDLRASTALLATIDDHEVTNDFAGGAPPSSDPRFVGSSGAFINETTLYQNGMRAFQEYNPLRDEFYGTTGDPRTASKRKLYRYQTYGGDAAVFVLDTRSFRDQALAPVTNPLNTADVARFLTESFNPARTMLGKAQLADLQRDLLAAERAGITWKFVLIPEPIQNLGVIGAGDRYEGYAAERSALLGFITQHNIRNVVFITADIHGTLVNNLTYQTTPAGPQLPTGAFEISTGAVAYDAPFGPTVIELARQAGLLTQDQLNTYNALPTRDAKDAFVRNLTDQTLALQGYNPIGLASSPISATLVSGSYMAVHSYGWTEFEVDAKTQKLRVITYGIDAYSQAQLDADPPAITGRTPAVVSEFVVTPQPVKVYLSFVRR